MHENSYSFRKAMIIAALVCAIQSGWTYSVPSACLASTNSAPLHDVNPNFVIPRQTIVIDPGHGGIDGGAYDGNLLEKTITLDIGLRMRARLQKGAFHVVLTRDSDRDACVLYPSDITSRHRRDLINRVKFIEDSKADLAVSIHVNHSTEPHQSGPIVFYSRHSEESKKLAVHVQSVLNQVFHASNHALSARYYVLRKSDRPTILVEVGFLSNRKEREQLSTSTYRQKMADTLVRAILESRTESQ